MIEADELIEWSRVYGNYYGVPKSQILAPTSNGNNVLLRVDVQGAMKIKNTIPEVILIFIKPDSIDSVKNYFESPYSDNQNKLTLLKLVYFNKI